MIKNKIKIGREISIGDLLSRRLVRDLGMFLVRLSQTSPRELSQHKCLGSFTEHLMGVDCIDTAYIIVYDISMQMVVHLLLVTV